MAFINGYGFSKSSLQAETTVFSESSQMLPNNDWTGLMMMLHKASQEDQFTDKKYLEFPKSWSVNEKIVRGNVAKQTGMTQNQT